MTDDAEILTALDDLTAALRENSERNTQVIKRAEAIRRQRQAGAAWRDIVSEQQRPLIVEMLTQNLAALTGAGSRLRRLEARALHAEGLSMEKIAELFGVSRQRISELLRDADQ